MRRIAMFFFVSMLYIQTFSQNTTIVDWKTDLDILQNRLLQKDYLFNHITKEEFQKQINQLKKGLLLQNNAENYWKLAKIITLFKDCNLHIYQNDYKFFPFEIQHFKNGYYITKIHPEYETALANKLIAINDISISDLVKQIKKITDFPIHNISNKSLLEFIKISKTDTLSLTLVTKNKSKTIIKLPFEANFEKEEMMVITPKKTPFYKEKSDRWFWMYGINFGQQVFFKYNVGLSKEYFTKMKQSLGWNALDCAKKYDMRLQSVYDAPKFRNFTEKLVQKFNNKRYKKLFIDLRGNKKGNLLALQNFIDKVANIKRINKRNAIFLLIDKTVHSSGIKVIRAFQKQTKAIVIGEKITGTINDTDKISSFYLPHSRLKVSYPLQKLEKITITPKILVEKTIEHYINGIDPVLQKVMEQ